MDITYKPSDLRSLAMWKMVENIAMFIHEVRDLPLEIRATVAYIMSKRGLITDDNIEKVSKQYLMSILAY